MTSTTRNLFIAATLGSAMVANPASVARPAVAQARAPAGGDYRAPADTLPPVGGATSPAACSAMFSGDDDCTAPAPNLQYVMIQDRTLNAFTTCRSLSPLFVTQSYSFTYGDWLVMEAMIAGGTIVPNVDGNVSIGTGILANVQELRLLESARINGTSPAAGAPPFPAVEARVQVVDDLHPTHVPIACQWEVLEDGTFSTISHCLQAPPDRSLPVRAVAAITFNVDCMAEAVQWWEANFPAGYGLEASTWLFNVGVLTPQRAR